MIRFFFIIGIVWLVSKFVRILFRSIGRPSQPNGHRPPYDFTKPKPSAPQMDFKDVKDAEFEDLPEKEKVSK